MAMFGLRSRAWPATVGATLYFIYAALFVFAAVAVHFTDRKHAGAVTLLAAFTALVCGALGVAILKAKHGDTGWLLWTGSAAGALAGMSSHWWGAALIVLPLALGLWGVRRAERE